MYSEAPASSYASFLPCFVLFGLRDVCICCWKGAYWEPNDKTQWWYFQFLEIFNTSLRSQDCYHHQDTCHSERFFPGDGINKVEDLYYKPELYTRSRWNKTNIKASFIFAFWYQHCIPLWIAIDCNCFDNYMLVLKNANKGGSRKSLSSHLYVDNCCYCVIMKTEHLMQHIIYEHLQNF